MSFVLNEIKAGETIQAGDIELTPVNQVMRISTPGNHVSFLWNRPKAVIVRDADGVEKTLPVVDVTRMVLWAMLAGGLLGALSMGLMSRRK